MSDNNVDPMTEGGGGAHGETPSSPSMSTPARPGRIVPSSVSDDLDEDDQQHPYEDHTESSQSSAAAPFFADAMLDLDEAHDIAETPEPVKPKLSSAKMKALTNSSQQGRVMRLNMPVLHEDSDGDGDVGGGSDDGGIEITRGGGLGGGSSSANNNGRGGDPSGGNKGSGSPGSSPNKLMTRISSVDVERDSRPRSLPRWPRDIPWTIAFWLVTPTCLLWPLLRSKPVSSSDTTVITLNSHPLSTATVHTLLWAMVATIVLSRLMYNSLAAGDGDDVRHRAAQFIVVCAPCHVALMAALAIFIWWACPTLRVLMLVPLWYFVHDLYFFRRWKQRASGAETTRQAFFQALVCMALDILSRSLRRASFLRVLSAILLLQLGVVFWWRMALLAAIHHVTMNGGYHNVLVLVATILGGKWATGTVTRFLTLLACGGVTGWFLDQSALLRELPSSSRSNPYTDEEETAIARAASAAISGTSSNGSGDDDNGDIPDAYQSVDASVYQSALDMDDALDDDYLEQEELLESSPGPRRSLDYSSTRQRQHPQSTVKSILWAGVSVSFGSLAQCGLLGGVAQFVWSQIRKVEAAQNAIAFQRQQRGFQGMQIGPTGNRGGLGAKLCWMLNHVARSFVSRYSDLAMSHVAAYYKSYYRAARDVAVLVKQSGTLLYWSMCTV